MAEKGIVYLVGAGPGDPGLLTLRGKQCLEMAEVVVYDYLANPEFLALAPSTAEVIYVGKKAGQHTMRQEDINALLVRLGQEGRKVVRLKGGDPYVFGRGGEEALELHVNGVPFEVVPGITSGIAAPAYAGIPVTQRGCSTALTLVTGHEDPTKGESTIDWELLARSHGTVAFYMGVGNLPNIVARLVEGGRDADTPVALIRCGTHPNQEVVEGTLATIVERVREADLKPPAITLVGHVVGLRRDLRWFDTRPLFGRRIVVTRSRTQSSALVEQLRDLGAQVLLFPTIRIQPPESTAPLEAAVNNLAHYDWIVFSSTNSVESFFAALRSCGGDARWLAPCRVAAVGTATADKLKGRGICPDLVPARFTSDGLVAALAETGEVAGKRFLLPRADIAPTVLPDGLRQAGGTAVEIIAYRTVPATPDEAVLAALFEGDVDLVTFTSSSTAANYASILRKATGGLPGGIRYGSIGPQTSATAINEGLPPVFEAEEHTVQGLVDAVVRYFERNSAG